MPERKVNYMKTKKLFLLISIVTVLLVGVASVSYAATIYSSPAELVAALTGKSVDQAVADRQAGDSYGAQALEAGKLEEFQDAREELFKARLDQAVTDGQLTQAEADERLAAMELRQETCDGTGTGNGQGSGLGCGLGGGMGRGNGAGAGLGNCIR